VSRVKVKICGVRTLGAYRAAVEAGADALGFNFWPRSSRYVAPAEAALIARRLSPLVSLVGVFVNEQRERIVETAATVGLHAVQLHGDEPPTYVDAIDRSIFRSTTLDNVDDVTHRWPQDTTLLLDKADPVRRGGTGEVVDWSRAAHVARARRIVLAGGLTADNVGAAIAVVRPYAVDVSSGIESRPGEKSVDRMRAFARAVDAAAWRRDDDGSR